MNKIKTPIETFFKPLKIHRSSPTIYVLFNMYFFYIYIYIIYHISCIIYIPLKAKPSHPLTPRASPLRTGARWAPWPSRSVAVDRPGARPHSHWRAPWEGSGPRPRWKIYGNLGFIALKKSWFYRDEIDIDMKTWTRYFYLDPLHESGKCMFDR